MRQIEINSPHIIANSGLSCKFEVTTNQTYMANLQEIWKDIEGTNSHYEISNTGRIRNKGYYDSMGRYQCPKEISSGVKNNGYLICQLGRGFKNKYIHRLVAIAFIPTNNYQLHINHKDGNKKNNIVTNLEWVTRSQNDYHSHRVVQMCRYPVLNIETGIFYANAAEAYEHSGVKYSYGLFKDRITNKKRKNTTKFIRA